MWCVGDVTAYLLRGCWCWCWDVCFLSGYSDRVVSVGWLAPERDIELRDCLLVVGPSKAKLGCHRS